jgi:hypothetical protein
MVVPSAAGAALCAWLSMPNAPPEITVYPWSLSAVVISVHMARCLP